MILLEMKLSRSDALLIDSVLLLLEAQAYEGRASYTQVLNNCYEIVGKCSSYYFVKTS